MATKGFMEEMPAEMERGIRAAERFLDAQGREIPDPNPVEVPVQFSRPETLAEQIQRMIRVHALEQMEADIESPEDRDDFDVGDAMVEMRSKYELSDDDEEVLREFARVLREKAAGAEGSAQGSGQGGSGQGVGGVQPAPQSGANPDVPGASAKGAEPGAGGAGGAAAPA